MARFAHNVPIEAAAEKVYAALATEKGMRGWWTRDTRMEETVGGKADFGFDRRSAVFHMRIKTLQPGKSVQMVCTGGPSEWRGTTLEWRIQKDGPGSVVSFVHKGWREVTPFAASCNSMWGNLLFRLKKYVETGKPNPQWTR